jgi:hypothetical protein
LLQASASYNEPCFINPITAKVIYDVVIQLRRLAVKSRKLPVAAAIAITTNDEDALVAVLQRAPSQMHAVPVPSSGSL